MTPEVYDEHYEMSIDNQLSTIRTKNVSNLGLSNLSLSGDLFDNIIKVQPLFNN